jgi:hypothetical protein
MIKIFRPLAIVNMKPMNFLVVIFLNTDAKRGKEVCKILTLIKDLG